MTVVVTYEDRAEAFVGVELLARSLLRHDPGLRLEVQSPSDALAARLEGLDHVTVVPTPDLAGRHWNVKPAVIGRALDRHERVLWLDTDVILCGPLSPVLARHSPGTLVVGSEYPDPEGIAGRIRTRGFGLHDLRRLPHSVNSGSILADRSHCEVIKAWTRLLERDDYRAAQRRPAAQRPMAMVGDQDALWAALLAHEGPLRAVDYFLPGREMLLHEGASRFSVAHRIAVLRGARPAFVHMLGSYKPWDFATAPDPRADLSRYLHFVSFELSPYAAAARPLASAIGDPAWLRRRSWMARGLDAMAFGNVALGGAPLALLASGLSAAARLRRRLRR
ncbi:hypothetical protein [Rhodobaculum claviforme]|uniref:Glycosyl transferase family 8 n=1 Tax=Rhodobaculum claviforme TaxID=1549854 RepID=A0A934TKK6_9RHOB|nr:hypothetical protein [Rhodobaculum claviforme]MBK5927323.1 hypothetical protein [Rhodobaculum claviforme]